MALITYPLSSFAVCLGAGARAANEAAKANYEHKLKVRERKWMNTLALTNVERIQYDQTIDATHVGLGNTYAEIQEKYGDLIGKARQAQETRFKEFAEKSPGATALASGQTGRSIARMETIDYGQLMAKASRATYDLMHARQDLRKEGAKAAGAARQAQMQAFANNNVVKNPDLAPPKPVYQNVGQAAFMDALSIGTSAATIYAASDRRLKENIKKIGESISGLGIYKFNYIGQAKKYIGAMADEVIKIVPEAATVGNDGFYRVNYDLIDVTLKEA